MIKMVVHRGGRSVLVLGLSIENIRRLQGDEPIYFTGEQVNLAGWDVVIIAGDTEEAIARDLLNLGLHQEPGA